MNGTIIGKASFFVSLSSILWCAATITMALMHLSEINIYVILYTLIASIAGLIAIQAMYHGMTMQKLLRPDNIKKENLKLPGVQIICIFAFLIGFVGFIRFGLNNHTLNDMMEGMSILTAIGFLSLSLPLILFQRYKISNNIFYACGGFTVLIALTALVGHILKIPQLYAPLPGGGTSVSTAMGFIGLGLWIILTKHTSLKNRITKATLATFVLIIAILAILGYITNSPMLYASSSFARLSIPTAIDFILIGSATFWYTWKTL